MTHIDHLLLQVPDLKERKMLDLGAGRGDFLIDAVKRGFTAEGVEYNPAYVLIARERAQKDGVEINLQEGAGEVLPFPDNSFDFINAAEVLEHVQDPEKVISEMARVLKKNGMAYVSVPNRFGFFDPHFHLYFVNWLPRSWSDGFIHLFGKQKNYADTDAGHQRLSEMHYMTRGDFEQLCRRYNFTFSDSRERKLAGSFLSFFLIPTYKVYSFFFIPTFHGLIK